MHTPTCIASQWSKKRKKPTAGVPEGDREALRLRFAAEVKRQLSLTPQVELAAAGQLPRFEMKAKRFKDLTTEPARP